MTNISETIAEEVGDQVDVSDVISGKKVTEQLDGARLGRAVGQSMGSFVGRRVGNLLFGRLKTKLGLGDDQPSTRSGRVLRALGIALVRTLSRPEFSEPLKSSFQTAVENLESRQEEASAAEEDDGEADETTDIEESVDISPDTLASLKQETYRDLLERMDYSKLQSLAKDEGVKANLKKEELVDRLVEKFGGQGDEEEGDEASSDGDESKEDES